MYILSQHLFLYQPAFQKQEDVVSPPAIHIQESNQTQTPTLTQKGLKPSTKGETKSIRVGGVESESDVEPSDPPVFIEKPKIVSFMEKKVVHLIVRYKSASGCRCSWYYKEEIVRQSQSLKVFHERIDETSYECRLEILEASVSDAGMYSCYVLNDYGQLQANLNLNIESEPEIQSENKVPPIFVDTPEIVSLKNGKLVHLIVRYKASLKCNCLWIFKETTIKQSLNMKIIHEQISTDIYEYRLEIHEPSLRKSGLYKCLVKNDHGQLQANLNLTIEKGSIAPNQTNDAPVFVEKPKIITFDEGKLVQLIVHYKASTKCDCRWYYKETVIQKSHNMKVLHEKVDSTSYKCCLEITNPDVNHAGLYKCLVKNDQGQLFANLCLDVEAQPENPVAAVDAPIFVEKPKIITFSEEKLVQLIVHYKASSKCNCRWYYKETFIQKSHNVKIFHEKVDSTSYKCWMEITNPGDNHAGLYKCLVKNDQGQLLASLNLDVESQPENPVKPLDAPVFVEKPRIVTHDDKKIIQLIVHYKAAAKCDCRWFYKETIIQKSQTVSIFHERVDSTSYKCWLEISESSVENAGSYKCLVKNNQGQLIAHLNLDIEAQPEEPMKNVVGLSFVEKPKIVTLNEGKLIQMIVHYKANSKYNCKWYFKETVIQQSQTMKVFHEKVGTESYKCWLEIYEPNVDNVGLYKCLVKGDIGQLTANLNLDIVDEPEKPGEKVSAPKFLEKPKILFVDEGKSAQLIVCYSAQSKCSCTWYYKEKVIEQNETTSIHHEKIGISSFKLWLEIDKPKQNNSGTYSCIIKNKSGQLQAKLSLDIESETEIHGNIKKPMKSKVSFGSDELQMQRTETLSDLDNNEVPLEKIQPKSMENQNLGLEISNIEDVDTTKPFKGFGTSKKPSVNKTGTSAIEITEMGKIGNISKISMPLETAFNAFGSTQEIDQPITIQESQRVEPIIELQDDKPNLQNRKATKSDKGSHHIKVLSTAEVEAANSFDTQQIEEGRIDPKWLQIDAEDESVSIKEHHPLEFISDVQQEKLDAQKVRPTQAEKKNQSVKVHSRDRLESTDNIQTHKIKEENVKHHSLKPEMEESVGIQESHKIETIGELQQEQTSMEKLKSKPTDNKKYSVKVQTSDKLESAESLDSKSLQQEKIEHKMLKPDNLAMSVGIQQSHEIEETEKLPQDHNKKQKIRRKQSDNGQQSVEVQSRDKLERISSIEIETAHPEKVMPKSLKPEEIEESIGIQESLRVESTEELQQGKHSLEKIKPKQSDSRKQAVRVQSKDKLESAKGIEIEETNFENIKPMSLKPEEIDESVGMQETQRMDSVSELQQKEPNVQKIKPKKQDENHKSIEVYSREKLDSAGNIEAEETNHEKIKPKSLKSEEIEECIGVQEAQKVESSSDMKQEQSTMQRLKPQGTEGRKKSVKVQSVDNLESAGKIEAEQQRQENIRPNLISQEAIDAPVSIQEVQNIDSIEELQQEESKMERVKPKQTGKGRQSIKVQSKDQLERVKSIEIDEISHENIKPKSLKPEEIDESVEIEERQKFESMSDLEYEQPDFKKLKPKESDQLESSIAVQLKDQVENSESMATLSSAGVKKASTKITDDKHQVVNIHDNPKMESTKELFKDQLKHEKTTSKHSDQKEISLEVQSSTKVENTGLDISMEPEINKADLQIIQKDKEMVNVESKLEIEGTDSLIMPSIETQRQKLKIKSVEKKEDSLNVETRESVEQTDDFKAQPAKGLKVKPKQSEAQDSSVDVETRQQLDTLVDNPPFMDDKKSERLKPISINQRREGLNVQPKESLIENTDDFQATPLSNKDIIKPSSIRESRKESFKIQQQDKIESTRDIPIADQNISEKVKPSIIKEERRSVSVTRPDRVEHAEDIEPNSTLEDTGYKIAPKSDPKDTVLSVTLQEKEDHAETLNKDEKPTPKKVIPTSKTPVKKPSLNVSSPKIHENIVEDGSSILQEKERAVLKTSEHRDQSLEIQSRTPVEKSESIRSKQPGKKKIKPKEMSQTNSSIEVEKTERFDSDLPMEAEEREMANQSLIESTNSTVSVEQMDEIEGAQKSQTSEPDQIHAQIELCEERADSLSIQKNQNLERTDILSKKQPKRQRLKSKQSERREQSVEVQLSSEVDSVSNLAHEQLDEERIQPKSMEVEQSVNIHESQKVEPTRKLSRSQPKLQKLKSISTDDSKQSVEIQSNSNIENTNEFTSEKSLTETIKPKSLKPEEIEQSVLVQENVDVESTSELAEKQPKLKKVMSKQSDAKEHSVAVDSHSKMENTSNLETKRPGEKKAKLRAVNEGNNVLKIKNIDQSEAAASLLDETLKETIILLPTVNPADDVSLGYVDEVDQDHPKSQKVKSQKLPKKEKSLEVNQASTTKLETATNLEEEQPPKDKTKIKPKSVKDKKTSIEVKNVEESENAIPIVTDETRKIHISVEPWNKIEEIAPLEVLDKDKIETADDVSLEPLEVNVESPKYLVEEPDTPSVEVKQPTFVKNEPLVSIANVEDVEIKDSSFVSLDTHDKSDTLKEQQTYPSSSEVYIFSFYYLYFPFQNNFTYTRNL